MDEDVEVTAGANDVMVRFKVVRLSETIPVVHKHAIGSCEGRLVADPRGLRYQTSNKDHAFDIPFAQVKSFEVDYLQKNLRLTRKDGKTFNFTDRNANADCHAHGNTFARHTRCVCELRSASTCKKTTYRAEASEAMESVGIADDQVHV